MATLVGELIVDVAGTRETSAFSYDPGWLASKNAFALAPHLPLTATPFYTNKSVDGSSLPSPIADGSPDSWGRAIIKAALGGRVTSDLDYLLESDDFLRSGALRYYERPESDASALAVAREGTGKVSIPRLLDLQQVIAEARAFETDPTRYRERRAKLIGGGLLKNAIGSLGGARPKVNALDEDGALWIVKLPKIDDQYAIARAEVMALRLAGRVGIAASTADVLPNSQKFPVAVVKRFDRSGKVRIPFISAQTFMGLPGTDPANYVDVAHQMHVHSLDPKADMHELYRRLMFNVLVQNTDDHLRNLGFLYRGKGKWGLSPAFDINPVPEEGSTLKTAISEIHGNSLDIESVIEVAPYFEFTEDEGRELAGGMATTIREEWRQIGANVGMTAVDFRSISHAMINRQIDRAIELNSITVPGRAKP